MILDEEYRSATKLLALRGRNPACDPVVHHVNEGVEAVVGVLLGFGKFVHRDS
jgi:hypothetical protein